MCVSVCVPEGEEQDAQVCAEMGERAGPTQDAGIVATAHLWSVERGA